MADSVGLGPPMAALAVAANILVANSSTATIASLRNPNPSSFSNLDQPLGSGLAYCPVIALLSSYGCLQSPQLRTISISEFQTALEIQ